MENKIISIGKNVIDLQIKALKKLKNSLDSNFEKAIKKIIKCESKIIICGVGKSGLIANKINKVHGIFNGTSNYILSSMHNSNKSFDESLKKLRFKFAKTRLYLYNPHPIK